MTTFAIVCWFILSNGAQVCSAPLPYSEALTVFDAGAQEGTSMPSFYAEGTDEFQAEVERRKQKS